MKQIKFLLRNIIYNSFFLKNLYFKFIWNPNKNTIHFYLKKYAQTQKNIFFIQVGANDGHINDPLYRLVMPYNWKGILIEPQKKVFDILKNKTYKKRNDLIFENVSISSEVSNKKLYKISFSEERWANGLSSFKKEILEKAVNNGYVESCALKNNNILPENKKKWIDFEIVKSSTFDALTNKHNVKKINLLIIDVEGYDFEIIKFFDFKKFNVDIVCYENSHLSEEDSISCIKYLEKLNYKLIKIGDDNIAFSKSFLAINDMFLTI